MPLTDKQQEVFDSVFQAIEDRDNNVVGIAGYAGTGKSYLLSHLAHELNQRGIPYGVTAPTGKAAARLRELGLAATTIHSWQYVPVTDADGHLVRFELRFPETPDGFVMLTDESSMIGWSLYKDLNRSVFSVPTSTIVLVGDVGQLPPVEDSEFTVLSPQICDRLHTLTEVLRQAKGNQILELATSLRSENNIEPPIPNGKDVAILLKKDPDSFLSAVSDYLSDKNTIILTWRNVVRRSMNDAIRAYFGFKDDLVVGDKLVILRNNNTLFLSNGDLIRVQTIFDKYDTRFGTVYSIEAQTPLFGSIDLNILLANGGNPYADAATAAEYLDFDSVEPVDYGYVLTVHKSQGSEWDRVLCYTGDGIKHVMPINQLRRWLYTAVTRARKSFVFGGGRSVARFLGF